MTTHNHCFDKDGLFAAILRPLFGYGLVFDYTTEMYKMKRKHCAHAFYKSHMADMQETFKRIIKETFQEWLDEIERSPDKMTTIDIAQVYNSLFSRNIMTIACGDDHIYKKTIQLELPESPDSDVYVKKDVTITKAVTLLIA